MTTLTDLQTTPLSGLNHIDALLDSGPDWNFLTGANNTLYYSFSTTAGTETFSAGDALPYSGAIAAMSAAQQSGARAAFAYLGALTGIAFVETANGAAAQIHLSDANLTGPATAGMCSWGANYSYNQSTGVVTSYAANAYVYLDNVEWAGRNATLAAGDYGYETLLHELGHALGLKHPFEGAITLPASQDSSQFTLMSYNESGGPYSSYRPDDIAALNWLYGGDGLGGALGVGSATGAVYLTGTAGDDSLTGTQFNDTLRGNGGNDTINGGGGTDTAVFGGAFTAYKISLANGAIVVAGADGTETLSSIEFLQFSDRGLSSDQVLDTVAPAAPTLAASKNAYDYVSGNTPLFVGIAEANAHVQVYSGTFVIGTATADASGFWNTTAVGLVDGHYSVYATAADAAGNVSAASPNFDFNVDAHAPMVPTGAVTPDSVGGNQPVFNGKGEIGSFISLLNADQGGSTVIGATQVDANGHWSLAANPLPNGSYSVMVQSTDLADNATNASGTLDFSVSSGLNRTGTDARDILVGTAGNNAIDGKGDIDTVNYDGARAGYTIAKSSNGFTVTSAASGVDSLINVERLHFGDADIALDINGHGGQAYRMFAAALDRAPAQRGLGFWMDALDNGVTLEHIAAEFIASPEFVTKYGANQTNAAFIDTLYEHVLHRAPKESGFNFWVSALDSGVDRAHVLTQFSESPENQAQVIGAIQNGLQYTMWHG